MQPSAPRPEVVVIDDDEADAELLRLAFHESGPAQPKLSVFNTGEAGLAYLEKAAERRPRPTLIVLLDLNMPGLDGRDVLKRLKASPGLAPFPVVVLTTSDSENDVAACYAAHANAYISKPNDLSQYHTIARRLCDFWFSTCKLPR